MLALAVLLVVSVSPASAETEAVLVTVPLVSTPTVNTNVAETVSWSARSIAGNVTVDPLAVAAWPSIAPLTNVSPAGMSSVSTTPVAVLGPLLVRSIVYVTLLPGAGVVSSAVLVSVTSNCGVNVVDAVLELLVVSESPPATTMLPVLSIDPVASSLTRAVTVNVRDSPTGIGSYTTVTV